MRRSSRTSQTGMPGRQNTSTAGQTTVKDMALGPSAGRAGRHRSGQFGTRFPASPRCAICPWRGAHGPRSTRFGPDLPHLPNVCWDFHVSQVFGPSHAGMSSAIWTGATISHVRNPVEGDALSLASDRPIAGDSLPLSRFQSSSRKSIGKLSPAHIGLTQGAGLLRFTPSVWWPAALLGMSANREPGANPGRSRRCDRA